MLNLNAPKITFKGNYAFHSTDVLLNGKKRKLWFKVKKEHADLLSDTSDAAALALLIPAMFHKTDLYIDGVFSEKLYHNFITRLQIVLQKIIPQLSPVKVFAKNLTNKNSNNYKGVATALSCGVDSFAVIADYYKTELPKNYQITHFIFNNVGQHGDDNSLENSSKLFEKRYFNNLKVANYLNLPLVYVDSNLDEYYREIDLNHRQTHLLRNSCVAHLLSLGIDKFYYASAYEYEDIAIKESKAIAISDPILLPLLSSDLLETISIGCEYSRIEKTFKISQYVYTYNNLDVCVKSDSSSAGNCSVCKNCLITQLTLDLLDRLVLYNNVFDLDKYINVKSKFMAKVMVSNQPLFKELKNYIEENNIEVSNDVKKHIRVIKRKKFKELVFRNFKKLLP